MSYVEKFTKRPRFVLKRMPFGLVMAASNDIEYLLAEGKRLRALRAFATCGFWIEEGN